MQSLFNEDYFERGIELEISGYSNYRWIPELTIPMAYEMIQFLEINRNELILDFGCAKGYLVKAFRLLHYEAFGYDISEYALSTAPTEIQGYLSNDLFSNSYGWYSRYDWIIAKDVFEHVPYDQIDQLLSILRTTCNYMFVIVPLGANNEYNIPVYENDKTHIIRESLDWWEHKFEQVGFTVERAIYEVQHIKENYARYLEGNGFFILRGN